MFFYEFLIVIAAMILGARFGGVFFGMCGGVGLLALILIFGLAPASPPIAVMLIMMSVVLAASTLQSSGGMAFLVRIAERLLRACPKAITFIAPCHRLRLHLHGRHRQRSLLDSPGDCRSISRSGNSSGTPDLHLGHCVAACGSSISYFRGNGCNGRASGRSRRYGSHNSLHRRPGSYARSSRGRSCCEPSRQGTC